MKVVETTRIARQVVLTKKSMWYLKAHPTSERVSREEVKRVFETDSNFTEAYHTQTIYGRNARFARVSNGRLRFGCCRFDRKQTAIIRKWALK